MLLPPSLSWVKSFCDSLSTAMGQTIPYYCTPTINPLIYKIRIDFRPEIVSKNKLLAWNMFQEFCSKNDCIAKNETLENSNTYWALEVMTKRRLGPIRDEHPLGNYIP